MILKNDILIIIIYFFGLTRFFDCICVAYERNETGLKVKNCLDKATSEKYLWPRRIPLEMSAHYVTQLNIGTIWDLYILKKNVTYEKRIRTTQLYGMKNTFNIAPFELKAGSYKIKISKRDIRHEEKFCFLKIKPEGAQAIIYGGTSRNIPPGEDINLDGTYSMDFCHSRGKRALVYKWQCSQVLGTEFCGNKIGKEPKFKIPGKFVIENDIITINLTVKNEDKYTSSTYQKLTVKRSSSDIFVWCAENCPPATKSTNLRMPPSFSASCEKNCDEECEVEWSVYKGISNPVRIGTSKTCSLSFCSLDMFKSVGDYKVVVTCKGKTISGEASIMLNFQREPEFTCKLDKNSGNSYDKFSLTCNFDGDERIEHFEVYASEAASGEKGEFLTSWSPPFIPQFRIAPGVTKLYVQATNLNGSVGEKEVPVKITPFLEYEVEPPVGKIKSMYFDTREFSVRYSIEEDRDIEEAVSRMRSVWDGICAVKGKAANKEYREFVSHLKLYAINDIENIPIESFDRLAQVSSIINKIISCQMTTKINYVLVESLMALCEKLARDMDLLLQSNEYPSEVADKSTFISNALLQCGTNSFQEIDLLAPMSKTLPMDSRDFVSFEKPVTEDYKLSDQYKEQYYEYLGNVLDAVNHSLNTNILIAKTLARTMPDDTNKHIKNTSYETQIVYKQHGDKYRRRIATQGIEVVPSTDIMNYSDIIFLSLTSWKKNVFWFSLHKNVPITYIANLDLLNMKSNSIVDVKKPHLINLEVLRKPQGLWGNVSERVTVPWTYRNETLNENYMEDFIKIHRISLFRYEALKVEFHNLSDVKFLVVVKNFEVPIFADFKNESVMFHKGYTSKYYRNDNKFDSWFYVAVLPTRDMVKKQTRGLVSFPYQITFSSTSCYSWSFTNDWDRTCKVGSGTNDTHISCECDHLSIVSGSRKPLNSKIFRMDPLTVKIEAQDYYLIYVAVLIIFIVFCIMILLSTSWTQKELYYAADNKYEEQYKYLIIVQSGGQRKTTARVVIKIRGVDRLTTHVLNYPDPEYKILQHGIEDWIVITTKQCLGEISEIVLWHDDDGIEPIWHCNNIVIYDLQTHEYWFFKINATLSASHKRIIVAEPSPVKKRLKGVFRERHSWSIFEEDIYRVHSYIVRLCMVYSKLITPLMISMYAYGIPMMEAGDSIDPYTSFVPDGFFFAVAVLGGLVSFVLHTILLSIFKSILVLFIVVPMILASNTSLVVYGLWIPHYSNIHIVVSWIVAVILDILIYENLLRLMKEYVCGTTKVTDTHSINFNYVDKESEIQRDFVYQEVGSTFVRDLELLRSFKKIEKSKKHNVDVLRRQKQRAELSELLIFGLYIILLYFTILWAKDVHVHYNHDVIRDLVEGTIGRTEPTFSELFSSPEIYKYINNTLIRGMQGDNWYGNFNLTEPGLLADFSNKLIGVVRIQQRRVRERPCESYELPVFWNQNMTCYPPFSKEAEETRPFDGNWSILSTQGPIKSYVDEAKMKRQWMYRYSEGTGNRHFYGDLATYPTGGYTMLLGRTKEKSLANFKIMETTSWLDRKTRGTMIEFLTYNANYNMFTSVMLIIERDASGAINTKMTVEPARMVLVNQKVEKKRIVVFIVFCVWVGYVVLNRSHALYKRGFVYFTSFWNFLDVAIILLSIAIIIIFLLRVNELRQVLQVLELSDHNEFILYFHLFNLNDAMQFIGAILIFLGTVRVWKLLHFFKMFVLFENTLSFGFGSLLGLTFYHAIIVTAFTLILTLSFGDRLAGFKSPRVSAESLMRIYMANFHEYDFHFHQESFSRVGIFVITVYMFLVKPIYRFLVAAELVAYEDALLYHDEEDNYSFLDYVKDEFRFIVSVYKSKIKRLRGGTETKNKVTPKAQDIFYQNCISTTTSSIKKMSYVTMILLRNLVASSQKPKDKLSEEEAQIMLQICQYFLVSRRFSGDEKEVFFKTHSHEEAGKKRVRLVDHRRMTAAWFVVETLLTSPKEKLPKDLLVHEQQTVMRENLEMFNTVQESLKKCLTATKAITVR